MQTVCHPSNRFRLLGHCPLTQLLEYLADLVVNGSSHPGAVGPEPATLVPAAPRAPGGPPPTGWRDVLLKEGPEGWARAVRAHKGVLLTDTTMCAVAASSPLRFLKGCNGRNFRFRCRFRSTDGTGDRIGFGTSVEVGKGWIVQVKVGFGLCRDILKSGARSCPATARDTGGQRQRRQRGSLQPPPSSI